MKTNFRAWLKAALIRAIRTVAQTAVASIGTAVVLQDIHWLTLLSTAALAGILSLLTSLSGLPEVKAETLTAPDEEDER